MFESDKIVERNFNGLIALSNPKYNLYQDQPNPTINQNFTNNKLNWAMFQDYLFCMIREKNSIFTYAEASKLKFNDILKFFENLNEKKLVCLKDINSINTYKNLRNFKLPNHE